MNFNPFSSRWTYHAARWVGRYQRQRFEACIKRGDFCWGYPSERRLNFAVASILGSAGLPEMLVCLSSILAHAGCPELFLIASDGSLSREDTETLRSLSPRVAVVDFEDHVRGRVPSMLREYLKPNAFIPNAYVKKLVFLLNLDPSRRWLFTDPDVLFFEGASSLAYDLEAWGERPAFMQDAVFSGDARQVDPDERIPAVNSGVLYLPGALDWSASLARLAERGMPPAFFAEQTAVHLAMRASGAGNFCPQRYVLALEDQWLFKDAFAGQAGLVCRHYVGTIRHKFWLAERHPSRAAGPYHDAMNRAGEMDGVELKEPGGAA